MAFGTDERVPAEGISERRRARMVALQVLYELDATTHEVPTVLARRVEEDQTPAGAAAYVRQLVEGVRAHQEEIDRRIAAAAPVWPLDQMARVDKCILRLALYEMLYRDDLPSKVAINEAVELAKLFGHDTSPKFVNGVLGTVERSRRGLAKASAGEAESTATTSGPVPAGTTTTSPTTTSTSTEGKR